jgi:hypothetical protein
VQCPRCQHENREGHGLASAKAMYREMGMSFRLEKAEEALTGVG